MTLRACGCSVEFNKQELDIGAYHGWWQTAVVQFHYVPELPSAYHVVKVEAGPETDFQDVACRVCRGSLLGREGNLVLKYFLLREAGRVQKSRHVRSLRRIEKPHPLAPHIPDGGERGYGDEEKNQEDTDRDQGQRADHVPRRSHGVRPLGKRLRW
jgi:hypothetical protein